MGIISIIYIAIALSADSFAVSVAISISANKITLKKKILIAFSFAFFQSLLPLLGWFLGKEFGQFVNSISSWVAFFLLFFIGSKMFIEGLNKNEIENEFRPSFMIIIMQSVATSIDAFAVGVSFALLNIQIFVPILIIGIITFIVSMIGLYLGKILNKKLGKYSELTGGIMLILIGIKIVLEYY